MIVLCVFSWVQLRPRLYTSRELCEDDFSLADFSLAWPPRRFILCWHTTHQNQLEPSPSTHVETFEQEPQVIRFQISQHVYPRFTLDMASDEPPSEPYTPQLKSLEWRRRPTTSLSHND